MGRINENMSSLKKELTIVQQSILQKSIAPCLDTMKIT
jgi:hypothetical protein